MLRQQMQKMLLEKDILKESINVLKRLGCQQSTLDEQGKDFDCLRFERPICAANVAKPDQTVQEQLLLPESQPCSY